MSISANFPNVRPSLLLDFANSQQLDPRVTFSRSTTAPYYDGKTSVLAEQNLALNSQDYTNAVWAGLTNGVTVVGDNATAPDGTTTADTATFTGSSYRYQFINTGVVTGVTYTFSVWVSSLTGKDTIGIRLAGASTGSDNNFSLVSLTTTPTRISVTRTFTSSDTQIIIGLDNRTAVVGGGQTTGDVIVWGFQIEKRSSVTAYNATTTSPITNYIPQLLTAPINAPRFDFNPVTSVALGLMREPSSTNVLFYSQDIGAVGYWSKANLAPTLNAATIAPDGNQTAQKLIPDSTLGIHRAFQSGLSYKTGSIYVKQSDSFYPYAYLGYYDGANYNGVIINLSNGALVQNVNSPTSYVVTSVGNGWFKISLTYSGTSAYFTFSPVPASYTISGGMPSYTGNSYSGCYVWQAQAEALSFSTSPIVTTFSQVTRAADIASITGTNFSSWFTQGQGTLYEEITLNTTLLLPSLPNFYDSATPTTNNIDIWYGSSANFASAGTKVAGVSYPTSTISVPFTPPATGKFAFSFATNQGYFSVDGSSPTNISSLSIPTVDTFSLFGGANTSLYSGGSIYIKKISYYPQALTSAQLQALTGS